MAIDFQPTKKLDFQPTTQTIPTTEPKPSIGGFLGNVVSSGANLIGGIAQTVMHPIKTAESIGNIFAGAVMPSRAGGDLDPTTGQGVPVVQSKQVQAIDSVAQYFGGRYGGSNPQEIASNVAKTAYKDPAGFLLDLSTLLDAGGSAVAKTGEISKIGELSKVGETISKIGETINPITQTTKLAGKGIDLLKGAPPTEEGVLGKITQSAKPYDIKSAGSALENIDTTGVKTYEDLSGKIQKSINTNLKTVDETLSQYKETFKPSDLDKKVPGAGKINYVSESLNDLKSLYKTIRDPESLSKITDLINKYKSEGLTSKEINDLAKEYGTEFGKKAFGKNGEPLTGVNSQAYENVRKGLKENARGILPDDATKALDKQTSEMIKTKELSDNMVKKVKTIQNKLESPNLFKKAGSIAGKTVDIASGGAVSKFLRSLLDYKPVKTLNAVEIQTQLQKNLSLLDKLDKMPPEQAYNEIIKLSATGAYYAGTIGKTNQSQ